MLTSNYNYSKYKEILSVLNNFSKGIFMIKHSLNYLLKNKTLRLKLVSYLLYFSVIPMICVAIIGYACSTYAYSLGKGETLSILFITIIIFVILSFVIAIKCANLLLRPILNLKELGLKASAGNFDIEIDKIQSKYNFEETLDIAKAFDKMFFTLRALKQSLEQKIMQKTQIAETLKEVNEELTAQQEELTAQQEELTMVNQNLMESNNKLENLNKELILTQTKLVQSEKMASLGMLVAGIAHEINTPLGAIHCNIDLFKYIISAFKSTDLIINDEKLSNLVSNLDKANQTNLIASERIMEIVKGLKNFARLDEAEHNQADIHEGIDSTLLLLNNKIKNKIEIIKEYGKIPLVYCYPNQLNQVFMNLLVNAIQAIQDKGKIIIKTYVQDDKVYIKIIDDGIGIKSENIQKIFDPGFTTKGVGVGTGLGLSIVYNIVEKHEGKIWAQSKVGIGTEFILELPINKELKS